MRYEDRRVPMKIQLINIPGQLVERIATVADGNVRRAVLIMEACKVEDSR